MRIVAKTDIGLKRVCNEDSYAAGELPGSVAWAVVCDGMGGATGGNIASSTAVKLISERISSGYHKGMTSNSIRNILISAITAANISVFDASRENPELMGIYSGKELFNIYPKSKDQVYILNHVLKHNLFLYFDYKIKL